jgi:hypothetical protein
LGELIPSAYSVLGVSLLYPEKPGTAKNAAKEKIEGLLLRCSAGAPARGFYERRFLPTFSPTGVTAG